MFDIGLVRLRFIVISFASANALILTGARSATDAMLSQEVIKYATIMSGNRIHCY